MVEVLGTRFNVQAYRHQQTVEVTVQSGVVALAPHNQSDDLIVLKEGNSGVYRKKDHALELLQEARPNALSWKTREMVFARTPLSEVVEVIGEVYHTPVKLAHSGLGRCEITVTFHQQELGAVLKVLSGMLDLEVQRQEGVIVLDGPGC